MNHRRLTPSMSLLLVFEAAGKTESYSRAAESLSLTQGAVSRQIQALEAQLGIRLFERVGRTVRLTDAGRVYHRELGVALGRIRGATLQAMTFNSGMGTLRLATLPTLGSKWLLPRLPDFYAKHPGISVHLHSRIGLVDFGAGDLDAAITVGAPHQDGVQVLPLFGEQLVAIQAPQTPRTRTRTIAPSALLEESLLTVASYPQAWSDWFSHHGFDHRRMRLGPAFELTSHLVQAVRAGLGVGLVPQALVQDELAQGLLVQAGAPVATQRTYSLIYPERSCDEPAFVAFRDWLVGSVS